MAFHASTRPAQTCLLHLHEPTLASTLCRHLSSSSLLLWPNHSIDSTAIAQFHSSILEPHAASKTAVALGRNEKENDSKQKSVHGNKRGWTETRATKKRKQKQGRNGGMVSEVSVSMFCHHRRSARPVTCLVGWCERGSGCKGRRKSGAGVIQVYRCPSFDPSPFLRYEPQTEWPVSSRAPHYSDEVEARRAAAPPFPHLGSR